MSIVLMRLYVLAGGPMLKKVATAWIAPCLAAVTMGCTLSLEIASQNPVTKPVADTYSPAVGLPDLSFGGTGYIQPKISLDLDMPDNYGSITRDSDDNIYMAGIIGSRSVVRALNPDGSIKTDFAQNGYFYPEFNFSSDNARITLVNDNGTDYLLVAAVGYGITLFRVTLDGTLDTSFGTDGTLELPTEDFYVFGNALVHSDGSIFVIYNSWLMENGGSTGMAIHIQKVHANGTVDTTYGTSGISKAVTRVGGYIPYQASTLDSTGRVVLLTRGGNLTTSEVWRLTTSGTLDTTFNGSGSALITTAGDHGLFDVQADTSNKVWVFGTLYGSSTALVYRLTSAGILDTGTFNSPLGYINAGFTGTLHKGVPAGGGAYRVLGRSGGKFAEWNVTSSGVMTLTSNPATSTPFTLPPDYQLEYFDGHPLVMSNGDVTWLFNKTGYRQFGNSFVSDSLLYRTKVAQEVDTSFNSGQVRIFNERLHTVLPNYSRGLKVDSSSRIYTLTEVTLGRDGIAALVYRYNSNGTLDSTFGNGGYALIPDLYPYRLALDSQNRVLVRGKKHLIDFDWNEGIWRLDSNGTLDTTFGNGGQVVFNPPPDHAIDVFKGSGESHPLVLDSSDNVLTMVYYYSEVDWEDKSSLWKVTSEGVTATDFGSQGILDLKFNGQRLYEISDLILQANGDIHLLKIKEDDDGAERVAMSRIFSATLQLDENFSSGQPWKFLVGPETAGDDARGYTPSWTIDHLGRFLVTTAYVTPASPEGYADKETVRRFTAAGDLDTTFLNGAGWSFNQQPDRVWFGLRATSDLKGRVFIIVDEGGPDETTINTIHALSDTGQPDTSFGSAGVITVQSLLGLTQSPEVWTDQMLTTPSGKVLLSMQGIGYSSDGGTKDLFVVVK